MTFEPLLNLPLYLNAHILGAMIALGLGPLVLWRQRRDKLHKYSGYVWYVAMTTVAISSFWIPAHDSSFHLGPLHGLAVFALWGLYSGLKQIWRRDVMAHKYTMQNLYYGGVASAGLFNFLPGRRVNRAIFPDAPETGLIVLYIGLALLTIYWTRNIWGRVQHGRRRRARQNLQAV